ncbi:MULTISPECIES: DUF3307 domain-containing protein [unclassified Streptomyces]|uniref:DUF3307 domain-containing protein n=1 Tax=unclassified Streptomyces TaxID=2593676 RepID=UPI00081B6D71|nr:DUF3307 domain-containing protein [Streptomyces sp. DvalAA-43]MYQ87918.1 DUF3307 domain-containing protein [Streptomyces sp. SID4936]SCE50483.1 Protein of unknown function [Streptomyces sp. DvalAA-43]
MFADLAFLLYVGHLIADYPLQTDHQAGHKALPGVAGWRANLCHAVTHVAVCATLLVLGAAVLGWRLPLLPALAAVLWIGATHAVIDRRWPVAAWMRLARQTKWAATGGAAHVDQTAHIAALVVAALCLSA